MFFCQFLLSNNLAFISGKTQKHKYKDGYVLVLVERSIVNGLKEITTANTF